VHKNIRSSMVKTVLESEASLRNYHEKMEDIRMDACCMHVSVYVSACQSVSAVVR
jgi:hypothetical protein